MQSALVDNARSRLNVITVRCARFRLREWTEAFTVRDMNATDLARELGKLGKGKPKTMSPAAIIQRQNAAKGRKRKRIRVCKKSIVESQNTSLHESVSV